MAIGAVRADERFGLKHSMQEESLGPFGERASHNATNGEPVPKRATRQPTRRQDRKAAGGREASDAE